MVYQHQDQSLQTSCNVMYQTLKHITQEQQPLITNQQGTRAQNKIHTNPIIDSWSITSQQSSQSSLQYK